MKQKQHLGVSSHPRVWGFASKNIYKFTEEFYESVRDFENLLEKAYQNSLLPDTVDVKKVSELLVKMNREFLKGEICCD